MKKTSLALALLLVGCSPAPDMQVDTSVQEQVRDQVLADITGNTPALSPEERYFDDHGNVIFQEIPRSDQAGIDIDLTQLSTAMVYGIVYQMMFFPEDYVGLTLRMEGEFFVWINPMTDRQHYSTIVKDALACCQQGLEFRLAQAVYPHDYPEIGTQNTVVGQVALYEVDGVENIFLDNALLQ